MFKHQKPDNKHKQQTANRYYTMYKPQAIILLLAAACPSSLSFVSVPTLRFTAFTRLPASTDSIDISEFPDPVVYTITSDPPLGVILTEFRSTAVPALTPTIVSDVSEGLNAAKQGVRNDDILIGIDGASVLEEGVGLEKVMETLGEAFGSKGSVAATFFRGSGYGGQKGFEGLVGAIADGENAEEAIEEEDIEDEVEGGIGLISVNDLKRKEDEQVGIGQLFGSLIKETAGAVKRGLEEPAGKPKKKSGGGIFGMFSQETMQIEDDPNQFANKVNDDARERD